MLRKKGRRSELGQLLPRYDRAMSLHSIGSPEPCSEGIVTAIGKKLITQFLNLEFMYRALF